VPTETKYPASVNAQDGSPGAWGYTSTNLVTSFRASLPNYVDDGNLTEKLWFNVEDISGAPSTSLVTACTYSYTTSNSAGGGSGKAIYYPGSYKTLPQRTTDASFTDSIVADVTNVGIFNALLVGAIEDNYTTTPLRWCGASLSVTYVYPAGGWWPFLMSITGLLGSALSLGDVARMLARIGSVRRMRFSTGEAKEAYEELRNGIRRTYFTGGF
jgi:hypothetical protein